MHGGKDHSVGDERRLGDDYGTITDFWRWAFGDLRANNVRGVFAEWMVAQLLGLNLPQRDSWADYDLVLPDGRTVEVKASAYLQGWHKPGDPPSVIQFGGLKGHKWDEFVSRRGPGERTYNADFYVFCVQTETDPSRWDAFDLSQWMFYVLPRSSLVAHGYRSIRLSRVQRLTNAITAVELPTALGLVSGNATTQGQNSLPISPP